MYKMWLIVIFGSVHASIDAKPSFVADHEYNDPVVTTAHAWQMRHAKFPVTHDPIDVGDHVKIRIKQSAFYKETFNSWSPEVYTVASIDTEAPQGKLYHLTGYRRPLLRLELKKIEEVHRFAGGELRSTLHQVQHPPTTPANVNVFLRLQLVFLLLEHFRYLLAHFLPLLLLPV